MEARIYITLKNGVHDAPGAVVLSVLRGPLGFESVNNVRIGRYVELILPDGTPEEQVREMCKKYLVNPTIEQFRLELDEGPTSS